MKNFKNLHQKDAGKALTVEYAATVNEHAVAGIDDAGNTVKLEYSNNPSDPLGKGETTEVVTHGYTFKFDIAKVDGETKAALAGVKFQLKKKGGDIVKLVVENAGDAGNPAVVRPAKADELLTAVDTVATPKSGNIIFKGLDATGYQLVEIKAPDGYNKVNTPIDVTITAQYDQAGVLEGWTVGGKPGPSVTIDVQNNKGALLPETGGMGTVIFTVAGSRAPSPRNLPQRRPRPLRKRGHDEQARDGFSTVAIIGGILLVLYPTISNFLILRNATRVIERTTKRSTSSPTRRRSSSWMLPAPTTRSSRGCRASRRQRAEPTPAPSTPLRSGIPTCSCSTCRATG